MADQPDAPIIELPDRQVIAEFFNNEGARHLLLSGDAKQVLQAFPESSVHACITSPPYWALRDRSDPSKLGFEPTANEYVGRLALILRQLKRVLMKDGSLWLIIGDTYRGKSLCGIPWRVALALQDDGWILRDSAIWKKGKGGPDKVKDKLRNTYEYVFHFVLSEHYYYHLGDVGASVDDTGISPGDVWNIPWENEWRRDYSYAVFPVELCEIPIKATCPKGGTVLDLFAGSGTTIVAALKLGRRGIGIDISPDFLKIAATRIDTAERRARGSRQMGRA